MAVIATILAVIVASSGIQAATMSKGWRFYAKDE